MAEFVMKDLVEKAGISAQFEIASAATSTEESACAAWQTCWSRSLPCENGTPERPQMLRRTEMIDSPSQKEAAAQMLCGSLLFYRNFQK